MTTLVDATTSEHARGIGTVIDRLTCAMHHDAGVLICSGPGSPLDGAVHRVQIAGTRPGRLLYQRLLLPFDVARLRRRGTPIERIVLLDAYIPLPFVRGLSRARYAVLVHDALPLTHPRFWPRAQRMVKRSAFRALRHARPLVFTSTEHNPAAAHPAEVVHSSAGEPGALFSCP